MPAFHTGPGPIVFGSASELHTPWRQPGQVMTFVVDYAEVHNNITLSGPQTIDGIGVTADNSPVVLLTIQTDPRENGPWVVRGGSWTRPTWWSVSEHLGQGQKFHVLHGTLNHDSGFVFSSNDARPMLDDTTGLGRSHFAFDRVYYAFEDECRTIYVSTNGNDGFPGTSPSCPVEHISRAVSLVNGFTLAATVRARIVVLDSARYAVASTIPSYCDLFAPTAYLHGNIVLSAESTAHVGTVWATTSGAGVQKQDDGGTAWFKCDSLILDGPGFGIQNDATVSGGRLICEVGKAEMIDPGTVFGHSGSADARTHIRVGSVLLGADGDALVSRAGGVVEFDAQEIIESAVAVTRGIVVLGGEVHARVGRIEADTAWNVHAPGTLRMFIGEYVGAIVETGTSKVTVAGTFPGEDLIDRQTLGADSQLTGAGLGATTEGIHTPLTVANPHLATARRTIRWRGRLYVDNNNAPDTWRTRWRIGGLGGVLVLDTGAWALLANEWIEFDISLMIRTIGAGGTFDCEARAIKYGGGAGTVEYEQVTPGGAIDTTGGVTFDVTGWSSTNNANQQVTLRDARLEVWGA